MSTARWFRAVRPSDDLIGGMEKTAKDQKSPVPMIHVRNATAEDQILAAIGRVKKPGWTHAQVAVPVSRMGDLEERRGRGTSVHRQPHASRDQRMSSWYDTVRADEGLVKDAGHVEDRLAQRAPGSRKDIQRIRRRIPHLNLRKGQTYHAQIRGGYAVIGDVGKSRRRHVVKTVLGPNMRPPGQDLTGVIKTAEIHLLTGGTGAGKSTEARRRADKYDHVFTTDIGKTVKGRYVFPPNKAAARAKKEARILQLHRQGKKVLVEGYPNGIAKYPGLVGEAAKMEMMGTSTLTRILRVLKRHKQEGRNFLSSEKGRLFIPFSETGWRPVKEDKAALKKIRGMNPGLQIEKTAGKTAVIVKGNPKASKDQAPNRYHYVLTRRMKEKLASDSPCALELEKIAKEKKRSRVPIVSIRPSQINTKLVKAIRARTGSDWTHPQVAVSVKQLGDLTAHGFKRTKLAIPLPGERLFTPTWRKGKLHAHKVGKHYLFHEDSVAPDSLVKIIKHNIHDVPKAVKARIRKANMRFKVVREKTLQKISAVARTSFELEFEKIARERNRHSDHGHWRKIPPGHKGQDQHGNPQHGRTWVRQNKLKKFVKLKKHQADFATKVLRDPTEGHIAAHGTGTGKTVSAIATFEKMKGEGKARRALIVAPAGLRSNFHKSVEKFTDSKSVIVPNAKAKVGDDVDYVVVSYSAFRRNPQAYLDAYKPDTLIADEFHRAMNEESSTHKSLRYARERVPNFMGLTASIAQNESDDAVPLVQIASRGRAPIKTRKQFRRQHVQRVKVRQRGIFGGQVTEKRLKNKGQLYSRIGGTIHYIEDLNATEKPPKEVQDVAVPMSSAQLKAYKMAMRGIDPAIRRKISLGTMLSKQETMHTFTALMRARQISNSMHLANPDMSLRQAAEATPKIRAVMNDVQKHLKETPDGKVIIYTNLVKGGVDVLSAGLKARGVEFGVFAGKSMKGMTESKRQQDVADYQAGKKRVIIITGAGAEGLSLGNTTMVAMADGHYNPERMNQAMARGIRAGGQSHRPVEKRKVVVKRYVSSVPRNFWQRITFQKQNVKSVGQWVYMTADRKARSTRELRDVLQRRHLHEKKKRESGMYRWFGGGP